MQESDDKIDYNDPIMNNDEHIAMIYGKIYQRDSNLCLATRQFVNNNKVTNDISSQFTIERCTKNRIFRK